jgi:hypothetical protein
MNDEQPVPARVTVHIPADEGHVFAAGALNRSIGQIVPLTIGGEDIGNVRVVSAEVDDDGRGFMLTYESASQG